LNDGVNIGTHADRLSRPLLSRWLAPWAMITTCRFAREWEYLLGILFQWEFRAHVNSCRAPLRQGNGNDFMGTGRIDNSQRPINESIQSMFVCTTWVHKNIRHRNGHRQTNTTYPTHHHTYTTQLQT